MSGVNLVFTFQCLHSFRTFMRKKSLLLCSWHAPLKRNKLFWETFIRTSLLSYFIFCLSSICSQVAIFI